MNARHCHARDAGESLVEILITIVILGITSVGLVGALSTGVIASDSHRRVTDAETVTRAYGELVKDKLLREPQATLTADSEPPAYAAGDPVTLTVDKTDAFATPPPYVAVDGSVIKVSGITATSITGVAQGSGSNGKGAIVRRYDMCVAPSFFSDVAGDVISGTANRIDKPSVTSVRYYASDKSLIATITADGDAGQIACQKYRTLPGATVCTGTVDWWTACDPAWIRATVAVVSSDKQGAAYTHTTTDVLIRRVS